MDTESPTGLNLAWGSAVWCCFKNNFLSFIPSFILLKLHSIQVKSLLKQGIRIYLSGPILQFYRYPRENMFLPSPLLVFNMTRKMNARKTGN